MPEDSSSSENGGTFWQALRNLLFGDISGSQNWFLNSSGGMNVPAAVFSRGISLSFPSDNTISELGGIT